MPSKCSLFSNVTPLPLPSPLSPSPPPFTHNHLHVARRQVQCLGQLFCSGAAQLLQLLRRPHGLFCIAAEQRHDV